MKRIINKRTDKNENRTSIRNGSRNTNRKLIQRVVNEVNILLERNADSVSVSDIGELSKAFKEVFAMRNVAYRITRGFSSEHQAFDVVFCDHRDATLMDKLDNGKSVVVTPPLKKNVVVYSSIPSISIPGNFVNRIFYIVLSSTNYLMIVLHGNIEISGNITRLVYDNSRAYYGGLSTGAHFHVACFRHLREKNGEGGRHDI